MPPALLDLSTQPPADLVGAKASRLGWLMRRGWPVPAGVVAPFEVTDGVGRNDRGAIASLEADLAARLDPGRRYIVRSSANVEDLANRSFAGQFRTVEDVVGAAAVLGAVREVFDAGRSPQVREYARHVGVDPEGIRVAAIVQELIQPVAAGVAFSRDPVTGADRVIIEAVAGRGESLVGRGADPQRWVSSAAGPTTQPDDPVLPDPVRDQIVELVRAVARESGEQVDVEWVWDGTRLLLVQWRPITGMAQPRIWSSRLARDMLPGLIPPLVWSVNVPVLSRVWTGLVTDALGDVGLDPDDLVRAFGYRAYFNTTAFATVFSSLGMPPDALERMRAGTGRSVMPSPTILVRRTPRLTRFAWHLATWARQAERDRAAVERSRDALARTDPGSLSDEALLARVEALRDLLARAGRLNVVTPLLADHAAATVRRMAQERGMDPGSIDPGQDRPGVQALDPAHALAGMDPTDEAARRVFLDTFGHLSDSPNDCSRPTWAEQPEVVDHLLGPVGRPVRARPADGTAAPATRGDLCAGLAPLQRRRAARRWDRAARLREVREGVGYAYARVYALFRPTLLEAGCRLVDRGLLAAGDDVFLLDLDEVRRGLRGQLPGAAELVAARRAEMDHAADLVFPETIIGDDPVPVLGRASAHRLVGVPTSRGRHTGPARVVTSLAAAPELGADDVLVLIAADVTWTPLLLRAGAVVTETGGMLAHASIVAREIGIPCVASVDGATRIPEGSLVSVDGGSGEVLLLSDHGPAEAAPPQASGTEG
jgi:pyruvate,water dikinase